MKDTEDDRITVGFAKGNRLGTASEVLLPLRLEVAQHVGAQGAFTVVGTCRLVVGNALAWHQEGSHGINQRRFSGADISREEGVFSAQFEPKT